MSEHVPNNPDPIFPSSMQAGGIPALDESGNVIIGMLHKAAAMGKEDCARAMDVAHRLSLELRGAEQRAREAEAQAAHFRDRANTAEHWLLRIHNELNQTFFQGGESRQMSSQRDTPPDHPRDGGPFGNKAQ
jgi:hypothetical protein